VQFSASIDLSAGASRCNCSVCTKNAWTAAIVKPDTFELTAGESELSTYEWGSKISVRYFCRHCGVGCFARGHLAEVGGDFVSVNLNCLDGVELHDLQIQYWDGRHNNWEAGPRATPWPILA
jgi:hypothetical protein